MIVGKLTLHNGSVVDIVFLFSRNDLSSSATFPFRLTLMFSGLITSDWCCNESRTSLPMLVSMTSLSPRLELRCLPFTLL